MNDLPGMILRMKGDWPHLWAGEWRSGAWGGWSVPAQGQPCEVVQVGEQRLKPAETSCHPQTEPLRATNLVESSTW